MVNDGRVIPAGNYVLRHTILVNNNVRGVGPGTHFLFQPSPPFLECQNDRAFTTSCDTLYDRSTQAFKPRNRIAAPIAIGDTSFQAADPDTGLAPGDWVIVTEKDNAVKDVVAIDWAQVASVNAVTVHVVSPFRTAFSVKRAWDPLYGGLGFHKAVHTGRNISLSNFSLQVSYLDPGNGMAAISIYTAQHISVDQVQVTNPFGQALYTYQSQDVQFTNCYGDSGTILSEFAATVDLQISNCRFRSSGDAALGFDLGTGFFSVSQSSATAFGIGLYLLYGVHDGSVESVHLPYVNASGNAVGILARGTQNVTITGNQLDGGDGASSIGLSIGAAWNLEVPIPSSGNVIAPDSFGPHWINDYDPSNQP